MKVEFLHGTETGTAEIVCEDLEEAVSDRVDTKVTSLEDMDVSSFQDDTLYVVVCSTFGSGDLPSTAEPFFDALKGTKPDLSHVRFAMFGLGDKTFGETYNQGSEKLAEALIECKAQMVGERGMADASSADMPEEVALPWLEGILEQAAATQS
ncbi:MAG: flavodoxin domain-containing protein [Pseudomonadota bacterium]